MKAGENGFPTLLILILVLFAVTASTFVFALLRAIGNRYQESVFLFGVAFVVLAFAVFTYRFYGYPDRKRKSAEED